MKDHLVNFYIYFNIKVTVENIAKLKFSSPNRSLSSKFEDIRWRAPEIILDMKSYNQKCEIYR